MFLNLVKGLDRIGESYVVNARPDPGQRIWVHDHVFALPAVLRQRHAQRVVGPNLFVMPYDVPWLRFTDCVYLQPCQWAVDVWRGSGFRDCPIKAWPVGIDTDEFQPVRPQSERRDVLLYYKRRRPDELDIVRSALATARIQPVEIWYGHYTGSEYQRALASASFVVWLGRHESQGLALLEALSSGVPVLVCDVSSLLDAFGDTYSFRTDAGRFSVTAAPYFDERCGIRLRDLMELPAAIDRMRAGGFRPREYVLETLSLERQARALLRVWDEQWGAVPTISHYGSGGWSPAPLDVALFRARRRLHHVLGRSTEGGDTDRGVRDTDARFRS